MAILYGVPVSPFVRKTMLAHACKEVDYELKTIPPTSDEPEFREASPFGKIPGYRTDDGSDSRSVLSACHWAEIGGFQRAIYGIRDSENPVGSGKSDVKLCLNIFRAGIIAACCQQ